MAKPPALTVDELRAAVLAGEVHTVLLAIVDMQGRLQGKRLHGDYGPHTSWTTRYPGW